MIKLNESKVLELIEKKDLNELKRLVSEQIHLQKYKGSESKRMKHLISISKFLSKHCTLRPALTGMMIQDNQLVYTDSYHAVRINDYTQELIESLVMSPCYEGNGEYPDFSKIFNHKESELKEIQVDLNEVLSHIKINRLKTNDRYIPAEKLFEIDYGEDTILTNPVYIKNVMILLGEDVKIYFVGQNRPILFRSTLGDGVVLPVRKY